MGRRKITDGSKKETVRIMVPGNEIEALGGLKHVQMIALDAVMAASKKKLQAN